MVFDGASASYEKIMINFLKSSVWFVILKSHFLSN